MQHYYPTVNYDELTDKEMAQYIINIRGVVGFASGKGNEIEREYANELLERD